MQQHEGLITERILKHYQYLCNRTNRKYQSVDAQMYLSQNNQKIGQIILAAYHAPDKDHALAEIERMSFEMANEMLVYLQPETKDL